METLTSLDQSGAYEVVRDVVAQNNNHVITTDLASTNPFSYLFRNLNNGDYKDLELNGRPISLCVDSNNTLYCLSRTPATKTSSTLLRLQKFVQTSKAEYVEKGAVTIKTHAEHPRLMCNTIKDSDQILMITPHKIKLVNQTTLKPNTYKHILNAAETIQDVDDTYYLSTANKPVRFVCDRINATCPPAIFTGPFDTIDQAFLAHSTKNAIGILAVTEGKKSRSIYAYNLAIDDTQELFDKLGGSKRINVHQAVVPQSYDSTFKILHLLKKRSAKKETKYSIHSFRLNEKNKLVCQQVKLPAEYNSLSSVEGIYVTADNKTKLLQFAK